MNAPIKNEDQVNPCIPHIDISTIIAKSKIKSLFEDIKPLSTCEFSIKKAFIESKILKIRMSVIQGEQARVAATKSKEPVENETSSFIEPIS